MLDLVVLRYVKWDFDDICCGEHREGYRAYCHPDIFQPISALVYHNDGKGHFTEEAAKLGLDKPGKGLGIALGDYDRDGQIDIVVANDSMLEFLYRNKGDGTFEEIGLNAEIAVDGDGRTYAGMGIDFQDYNNDGLPDLVVTDLANQKYALYQNNGDGSFTYDTYMSGIGGMTLLHSGWGIHFLDYDNDGLKDLLVAQGHDLDTIELNFPQLRYKEPMLLARNTGKGFVDVSSKSGAVFQQAWVGRGMAVGDLDNDGRVDAVVTTNDGPAYILRNETATAQSLAHALARRPSQQPRCHRRGDSCSPPARNADAHRIHRRQLSVIERQARSLRLRQGYRGQQGRNPLAERHRADPHRCERRPHRASG